MKNKTSNTAVQATQAPQQLINPENSSVESALLDLENEIEILAETIADLEHRFSPFLAKDEDQSKNPEELGAINNPVYLFVAKRIIHIRELNDKVRNMRNRL